MLRSAQMRLQLSAVSSSGLPSAGATGESPLKGHEDDEGIGRSLLWGKIKRCGIQTGGGWAERESY